MNLFFALCISPILVGVALLAFEYFVVQPYQDSRDLSALKFSPDVNDTWSTALRSGLKQFKHFQNDSPIAWTNDRVKVEGIRIKQDTDTAILNVRVTPRASILFFLTRIYSSMNVDGMTVPYQSKYRVNIDSSGSVKEIQLLEESEIHRTRGTASAPKRPPPNGLVLKEISEPVTEIVDGQLNVEIRFLVENWGESRTIHPVVEYKAVPRFYVPGTGHNNLR